MPEREGSDDDNPQDFVDGDDSEIQAHWALLIAGSSGWGNYRHQSDVAHAYHVLRRGGYQERHIVVMMADDIAENPNNPCFGKIFNNPVGPDVYDGLRIDYRGLDVTAETFLAVLAGDTSGVDGIGTGRVIASRSKDRVFVFYSDHGATGILGMPTGDFLFADQLKQTLAQKYNTGGYHEAVLYIEACESGSMFEGMQYNDINVYITTASNPTESSWGTYCPGMNQLQLPAFDTCLGDLYSVSWMEESEYTDLTKETLEVQFQKVRLRTSNNMSYAMGSHAMQYGRMSLQNEKAGDYIGMNNSGEDAPPAATSTYLPCVPIATAKRSHTANVEQREADLLPLRLAAQRAQGVRGKQVAQAALDSALTQRIRGDASALHATRQLLLTQGPALKLAAFLNVPHASLFSLSENDMIMDGERAVATAWVQRALEYEAQYEAQRSQPVMENLLAPAMKLIRPQGWFRTPAPRPSNDVVAMLATGSFGRPTASLPVVDSWDCLRGMMAAWSNVCGAMDQYTMRHSRLMVTLCNAGIHAGQLEQALQTAPCSPPLTVQV